MLLLFTFSFVDLLAHLDGVLLHKVHICLQLVHARGTLKVLIAMVLLTVQLGV